MITRNASPLAQWGLALFTAALTLSMCWLVATPAGATVTHSFLTLSGASSLAADDIQGLAIDNSANLYMVAKSQPGIFRWPNYGTDSTAATVLTPAVPFSSAQAIYAHRPQQALFVLNNPTPDRHVLRWDAWGTGLQQRIKPPSAIGDFSDNIFDGVWVDELNYLYVGDWGNNRFVRINSAQPSSNTGDYFTVNVNAVTGSNPNYLMVDSSGNVIVSISDGNDIWVFPSRGAGTPYALGPAGGTGQYSGFAVDAVGNLWISNIGGNQVLQTTNPYTSAAASAATAISLTGTNPRGLVADPQGLFVAVNNGANAAVEWLQGVNGGSITGFRGQHFQVHGVPGHVYDLVSTPDLQLNARFVFLAEGRCPSWQADKFQCFSHPGTFLGEVALTLRLTERERDDLHADAADASGEAAGMHSVHGNSTVVRIHVKSGPADVGLQVLVDGEVFEDGTSFAPHHVWDLTHDVPLPRARFEASMAKRMASLPEHHSASASAPQASDDGALTASNLLSDEEVAREAAHAYQIREELGVRESFHVVIDQLSKYEVSIWTPALKLTFVNSDNFLNHHLQLLHMPTDSNQSSRWHGLLGQTVRAGRYANKWRYVEGTTVEQYSVSDLFSCNDDFSVARSICNIALPWEFDEEEHIQTD